VTSTGFTPNASGLTQFRNLNEEEIRQIVYLDIKSQQLKGYATLHTNYGELKVVLHCNFAPIACESFLELLEQKYYDGSKFFRLIKDFMVCVLAETSIYYSRCRAVTRPTPAAAGSQSSSAASRTSSTRRSPSRSPEWSAWRTQGPTRTGRNCTKLVRQIISVPRSFITTGACPELDRKHTILGEIITDESFLVLSKINQVQTKGEKPKFKIILQSSVVHENPYRSTVKKLLTKEALTRQKNNAELQLQRSQDRWVVQDEAFKLPPAVAKLQPATESIFNKLQEASY